MCYDGNVFYCKRFSKKRGFEWCNNNCHLSWRKIWNYYYQWDDYYPFIASCNNKNVATTAPRLNKPAPPTRKSDVTKIIERCKERTYTIYFSCLDFKFLSLFISFKAIKCVPANNCSKPFPESDSSMVTSPSPLSIFRTENTSQINSTLASFWPGNESKSSDWSFPVVVVLLSLLNIFQLAAIVYYVRKNKMLLQERNISNVIRLNAVKKEDSVQRETEEMEVNEMYGEFNRSERMYAEVEEI